MSVAVIEAGLAGAALTWAAADYLAAAGAKSDPSGRFERLAVIARRFAPGLVTHTRMRERAAAAGMTRVGEDLLALKAALAIGCGLFALPLVSAVGSRGGVVAVIVFGVLGFFAPD